MDNEFKVILAIALVAIALLALGVASGNCADRGGVLVRGAFGFECVEPKP